MSLAAFSTEEPASGETIAKGAQPDLATRLHQQIGQGDRASSVAENCLLPLLKALNWDGMERHLFEALPHLEGISNTFDLRAVLTRLNYRTLQTQRRLKDLTNEHFPCLLDTGDDVFVCYRRSSDGKVHAFSGRNQHEVTIDTKLDKTGDLFLINPDDASMAKTAEFKHWSSRLFHRFRGTILSIFLVGFLTNLLALGLPLFVMNVYDKAIAAKSPTVLVTLLAGICVILVMDGLVKSTKARLQAYFGSRLDAVVANTTFRHFLHLPLPMINSAPIGSQIIRLRQFDSVRDVFHGNLANAIVDLPFSAIFVVALALIAGPLAILPAGLLILYVIGAFFLVPRMRRAINVAGEAKSRMQNATVETLTKHKAIRDLSADEVWIDRYRNLSADFSMKNLKTRHLSQSMQVVSQTLMTICGIGVLGFGAVMVMSGSLTPGALIAVMALSWRSLNPMHQAFLSLTQLGQAQQTIERIDGLLKIDLERQPGKLPSLHRKFGGTVRFSSVVLRYPGRNDPALRNFSLQVDKGTVTAITGPSGAGKSSIIKTALGLYRPQMGAVLVDDLDIRQLDPGEWRYAIGYAPEHFDFFYGTVAQNLRMANPQADNRMVQDAFDDFGLDQFSDLLPEGPNTRLTGQLLERLPDYVKQRILLARAFIRPAPIYLLDNPAGNLDFEGDKLLMKKINKVRGESTILLSTYRPSHMRLADQLVYLRHGQVAVAGKPDEVLDDVLKLQSRH
ncbi:ATP-binding cassette subfamily C protein/ATP-binding cassette subfamily C protein LapB [Roseibium hamelinense]|uniref:ATP-binding cassette subfamily C protein/ATP-binding cassette subfamily C protein LapB n=1 Tax=Roseibium hamelinense TaxID=150831 RepID=A0A562SLS8_9HYPH|nr:ATP-binding cassette domain-containing protein [Roseibium hamelinense]MTI42247.1 ATP-binding cassette domain-containing protein [Roseibium hamelinense]TWI82142.1 ATP-binding cassette subfamily C protein/ATP-binding cassette subfamily C protein LapB [Roseibium hamelinense]